MVLFWIALKGVVGLVGLGCLRLRDKRRHESVLVEERGVLDGAFPDKIWVVFMVICDGVADVLLEGGCVYLDIMNRFRFWLLWFWVWGFGLFWVCGLGSLL